MDPTRELHRLLEVHPGGLTPRCPWDFNELSGHKQLPSEYVRQNLSKNWNSYNLILNEDVDVEVRLEFIDAIDREELMSHVDIAAFISELPIIKKFIEYGVFGVENLILNEYLTLESLLYLIEQPGFKLDLGIAVHNFRPEVTKWLISRKDLRLNWALLLPSCDLTDEELFDKLIEECENYEIDSYYTILDNPNLSSSQMLKLLQLDRFKTMATTYEAGLLINHSEATLEVSKEVFSVHKEALFQEESDHKHRSQWFHRDTNINEEILEEMIDRGVIKPHRAISNYNCTSYLLSKFIRISRLESISIYRHVVKHYCNSRNIVDVEIIRELSNLNYLPQEMVEISYLKEIMEIIDNEKLRGIQWKFQAKSSVFFLLVPIIKNIHDLKRLMDQVYTKYIYKVKLDFEVDNDIIELLIDRKWSKMVSKKKLTKIINHEIIIDHPNFPWNPAIISRRKYYPSNRFLKTKKAAIVNS